MTRILVVEDERIVARDLQESLERMGYEVVGRAASSEEALEIAANRLPALVMMDIRIDGEVDGIETANVLRSRFDIPVIFLTAYADDDTLVRAKNAAPLGYIIKPFKSAEIRGAIEMALVRHELERRLRESEHWFQTTLRSVGDAVLAADADGVVRFANPVAEALMGASQDSLLGRAVEDVLQIRDERSNAPLPNPVTRALRDRRAADLPEAVLLASAPGSQPIEDSSAPIVDDSGRLLGAVMVFRDVTEKRREQLRAGLNERLTSLGTLVAGVAHELNNPLTALYGHSELLRSELDDLLASEPPQPLLRTVELLHRHASAMEEASHMMGDIVADLRLFASPQPDELERIDVRAALDTALRRTSALVRERARLVLEIEAAPQVMASKRRLVQVFINLLTNAAQAIPAEHREENQILVRLDTTPQGDARVSIRDTGAGMSSETSRHIFDPFFTTKKLGEGSGLGLSISHGIVRSFHGSLSVVSEPGRGSLFIVTLPPAAAVASN